MRKLVWFSLGFGAACCLCAYVITGSTRVILGAAVGFLTLFAAIAGRKFALFRRIAAVLLGFAMGVGWFILYDGFYLNAAGTMDGKTADAVIRVSDYSYETAYGIGVDGTVQLEGKSYRLRAYLDLDKTLEPGDTVSASSVSAPLRLRKAEPITRATAFSCWRIRRTRFPFRHIQTRLGGISLRGCGTGFRQFCRPAFHMTPLPLPGRFCWVIPLA